MKTMKYLFVINPNAGQRRGKQIKSTLESKIQGRKQFSGQEYKIIIPPSVSELDKEIRNKIEKEGFKNIVAVGGDGTIAAVTRSMVNYEDVTLGIIPQGTGNVLAANIGLSNSIDSALETIFFGKSERIDLGRINDYSFTIMVGTGVPAGIIEELKQEEKALLGIWAYVIKGLEHLYFAKEFDFHITMDGKEEINTKSIAVFVSNAGNFLGPFPTITPEAKTHDGYLDVFIVSLKSLGENPVEYFELLINYLTRNLKKDRALKSYKAKEIIIDSLPKLKVQADGDIIATTPVKINILPKKLNVFVPTKQEQFQPNITDIIRKIEEVFKIKLPR